MPLIEQMNTMLKMYQRQRHGLRFLKKHEIAWLISAETHKRHTALSL